MDVVTSLDSPGTSSGYCSGTEEEMAFSVSIFESGLPTGSCDDIFSTGGAGSFPSYIESASGLDCACPGGQDSLMTMNPITSGSAVAIGNFDDDRVNSRELRDSWLFEMLFGTQTSTNHDEEEDLRNDLDLDNIDFETQLLSVPLPEGPTEVLPMIASRASPLCDDSRSLKEKGGSGGGKDTTTGGEEEEDWNVLMSFDDWNEVCDEDDEVLFVHDDLTLRELLKDADEHPAKRRLCSEDDKDVSDECTLMDKSTVMQGSDTHQLLSVAQAKHSTSSSAVALNHERIEVTATESPPRCFDAPSWTSPTGPPSSRAGPASQLILSSGSLPPCDQSSRLRNCFRLQQQRPSSTTLPPPPPATPATAHHMLEDHRYSTRRIDHVVKPVQTTTTTTRQPEVERSSQSSSLKYSVLETLLRTSARFNPNHGSSFIVTKESKKRSLNNTTKTTNQTTRQSTPCGGSQQTAKRLHHQNTTTTTNNNNNSTTSNSNSNSNTLLHNLLTCRMEEMERKRVGCRKSGPPGKGHLSEPPGKDHMAAGKNTLIVGLIPSDDPVVDCSFLYDGNEDLLHVEDHNVDLRMAWMEKVMEEDCDKTAHYASDDESDTWFANYFNQSSS